MAPQLVELAPFVTPAPVGESRCLECQDSVVVGDIIDALSQCLGVSARALSLLKQQPNGRYFVLHRKEPPTERLFVRGAKSLAAVPGSMQLAPARLPPVEITKEIAQQIQADTIQAYDDALLKAQLQTLRQKCITKWIEAGKVTNSDFTIGLRSLLQPRQATFFPKWGYEVSTKGMVAMQQAFNVFSDDEDIQNSVDRINTIVGTDFAWIPPELFVEVAEPEAIREATKGFLPSDPDEELTKGPPLISEADIQE